MFISKALNFIATPDFNHIFQIGRCDGPLVVLKNQGVRGIQRVKNLASAIEVAGQSCNIITLALNR